MNLLQRCADADDPASLSNRFRARRFRMFERLASSLPRPLRIIDLGGTPEFWELRGCAGRDDVRITTVNITAQLSRHENIDSQLGDVTDLAHFADDSFDIAFSNSVIEHLETFERQQAMAGEIRRLAPAVWLQTPSYWFPIEPHFHVPGWQWLPLSWRRKIIQRRQCGWRGPCPDPIEADAVVREVRLLTGRELRRLFPHATIASERFAGFVKSWIVHSGFAGAAAAARRAA